MEINNQGENLIVIVVSWNRKELFMRTIDSLNTTVKFARVIIVDNNSTDGTKQLIEEINGRKFILISKEKNDGWGAAVNEALVYIDYHNLKADYILLSNNDVEYKEDWYAKAIALYEKYPKIGVLGLWKHPAHGVQEDFGDLVKKDQMPAVAWLLKLKVIADLGLMVEHGECLTRGGNGEDVDYCILAEQKGYWVAGPVPDLAIHIGE